jgi:hypothetical protein
MPLIEKTILSNQVRFDQLLFSYRQNEIIDKFVEEEAPSALQTELTLELVKQPGTYVFTHQRVYFIDLLDFQQAFLAKVAEKDLMEQVKVVVNLKKQLKSYKDAMNRSDASEWYKSYRKEWRGFKDHNTMDIVQRFLVSKGSRCLTHLHSDTHNEYKTINGILQRQKTRWCRGHQQLC